MLNFTHDIPTRLYFGKGQLEHLTEELGHFGTKVLLAYGGGSIKRTGLYDKIMGMLTEGGFTIFELDGIEPNPRIESVQHGVELCRNNNIDVILAVGGGSTIDCSKAVAVGTFYDGDLWEMVTNSKPGRKALPLVDVLTIAATGSEFDGGGVISNLSINEKVGASFTYPAVSFCDPELTFTVPARQTAAGSADIMSHIFEGYFSRTADSDLSDGIAETILKSVIKNLPAALATPDDYAARANLMANSSVACSGIPEYGKQSTAWPCHAMEHQLSAYYDITHGIGLAILTPRWMRHILAKDPEVALPRFVRFAKNVWGLEGEDNMALAQAGIDKLESFFKEVGIPMTLTELNIDRTHFDDMAAKANKNNRLAGAFVSLDEEDVKAIYEACL